MIGAWLLEPLGRAFDHGVTGRVCRRLFDGSVLAFAARRIVRALPQLRRRLGVGFSDPMSPAEHAVTGRQLAAVFDRSAIVRTMEWYSGAFVAAARQSAVARVLSAPLRDDDAVAARAIGAVLLSSVAAHVVTFAVLGVTASVIGWSTRALLALVGAMLIGRPLVFARAWAHSRIRRRLARAIGRPTAQAAQ